MKSPLEREVWKEKAAEKCHRSSGKQSKKNIYSNKVNSRLGKIQNCGRTFLCVFIHTHLSPDLNRAILLYKGQQLSTLLSPSKQTHCRNPWVQYSPLFGACLETYPFRLTLSLNWRAAGVAHYSCRERRYIWGQCQGLRVETHTRPCKTVI